MKRRNFFAVLVCLVLSLSLLSLSALAAERGKEPQRRGKTESSHSAAYELGYEFGRNVARVTAGCLAVGAVCGIAVGVASRSRHRAAQSVQRPLHRAYYRPAAKGESCGRMPEVPEEPAPWVPEESPVWQNETPSPWPLSPEKEVPPAPMEEPAPVHPTAEDNPFAEFEEFFGGYSEDESTWEELPEEPGDDEPGDVYFKI